MKEYEWQKECIKEWFHNEGHGIVQAVTGAGKTRMALSAAEQLERTEVQKLYVRIVVPTTVLMKQWEKELRLMAEKKGISSQIGQFGNGHRDSCEHSCMVYTIHSARYHLARHILQDLQAGHAVLLIADECHHYASRENQKIFEFLPYAETQPGNYYSLGLTATPNAGGYPEILISALGKPVYSYKMQQAIRNNTLCPCVLYNIAVSFSQEETLQYEEFSDAMLVLRRKLMKYFPEEIIKNGSSFFAIMRQEAQKETPAGELSRNYLLLALRRKKLVCQAGERIECADKIVTGLCSRNHRKKNRCPRILIFGERIEQVEEFYQLLNQKYPGKVGRYHSKMGKKANENTIMRFQNGELYMILSCRAMDEGVDLPAADAAIILSGTSVQRQHIQRMGRVVRKNSGKKIAALYYLFIKDSMEEQVYFLEHEKYYMADLEYDSEQKIIRYEAYENAAERVLSEFLTAGAEERAYEEAIKCLQEGELLPDWFLKEADCREFIDSSSNQMERNYWYCIKKMSMIRNSQAENQ